MRRLENFRAAKNKTTRSSCQQCTSYTLVFSLQIRGGCDPLSAVQFLSRTVLESVGLTTPHCGDSAKVSCVYAATLQHITEVWVLLDHSCDPLRSDIQVR